MKFGEYLTQNVVPEWKHKYINYNQLKNDIKFMEITCIPQIVDDHDDWTCLVDRTTLKDNLFIVKFHQEVHKVEQFLQEKVSGAIERFRNIAGSCMEMAKTAKELEGCENTEIDGESNFETNELFCPMDQNRIIELKPRENSAQTLTGDQVIEVPENKPPTARYNSSAKKVAKKIHLAICEFYRFLELLSNYRVLNEMAAQKILKKFSKRRNLNTQELKEQAFNVLRKDEIKDLIEQTLNLYVQYFEPDRRKATEILKPREFTLQPVDIYISGLLTGLSVPILAYIVSTMKYSFTVFIYAGLSIPILFLYLFGLCLLVFQIKKINWILIFELDPKAAMTPIEFTKLASILLFGYTISFYLAQANSFNIPSQIYPITLVGAGLIVLFLPFKVLNFGRRKWIICLFGRILSSGLRPVHFRDFFVSDLLVSLTYSFISLESVVCLAFTFPYQDINSVCQLNQSPAASIITCLPAYFRLVQCLRRYHDTKNAHPHLVNGIKYILSISTIILSLVSKFTENSSYQIAWVCVSVLASVMAYCWDILFDWGLLRQGWLRNELAFPQWIYYLGIVLDFPLRFTWAILLAPYYWNSFSLTPLIVYICAILEVFRRSFWAVLRMENEHSNNVGQFRVTKELPLPF